jgi:hypothetical protein
LPDIHKYPGGYARAFLRGIGTSEFLVIVIIEFKGPEKERRYTPA